MHKFAVRTFIHEIIVLPLLWGILGGVLGFILSIAAQLLWVEKSYEIMNATLFFAGVCFIVGICIQLKNLPGIYNLNKHMQDNNE